MWSIHFTMADEDIPKHFYLFLSVYFLFLASLIHAFLLTQYTVTK